MRFQLFCAMCGKIKECEFETEAADPNITIRTLIEHQLWIVQMNGVHMDIYCSRRCAA